MTDSVSKKLSETQKLQNTQTARILIVQKDVKSQTELSASLASQGYEIQTADSVWDAFEKLIDYSFDLILCDAAMPGTSNLEVVRYCQKRHPVMEIVIMSRNPEISEAVSMIKEGAFDYIKIPISSTKILEKVKEALSEQKSKIIKTVTGQDHLKERFMNPLPSCDLIRHLGAGASGVVLLVKRNKEKYALKILRRDFSLSGAYKQEAERFLREAEILSKISHPNIVKIFEYGFSENGNTPYIMMEYIYGDNLIRYIEENSISQKEKLKILQQICKALSAIHKQGILHRDIKPGNIMLTRNHVVKLTDFGIAKTIDSEMTISSDIMGSPAYMSPEAFVNASKSDQRSDIFSLGVLAYELFTGSKPFKGFTVTEIMRSINNEKPVDPRKLVPDLPETIQHILGKMVNKRPEDRFQSVDDVLIALESVIKPGAAANTIKRSKGILNMLIGGSPRSWS
ncbi:MAG: protein kinase [Victivallaceae bacterium]